MNPPLDDWLGPFQISYSGQVYAEMKALYQRAKSQGLGSKYLATILSHLRKSAREFGEPLFHYQHAALQARVGVIAPVAMQYAVHEQQPLVLLRKVVPLF